jgi:ABC-2 type transport system permease protein
MNRIFVVATTEFLTLVKTKAFIIGILMAPVLIAVSIGIQVFAAKRGDVDDHKFAVIDRTGALYDMLAKSAADYNTKSGTGDARKGPHFLPFRIDPGTRTSGDLAAELSGQVRHKDLFAFVEIPATILDVARTDADQINYYTETPSYDTLPTWLGKVIDREVTARRFSTASVDPSLVAKLTRDTKVNSLGLVDRKADGTVSEAKEANPIQTFVMPFALMYLLFIALMSSAPQLLTAIIEEKMSRISEVLIASITPFQLMAGKLIGVAGVATLLALVYLGGGLYALISIGQLDLIQPALIGWFLVFLLCAVLMFGSIFIAIGSACSDIKDSQSMMQTVMVLLMLPIFAAPVVLRAPGSTLSVVLSMIPTATPFLMLLRLAMTPPPPLWQVGLAVVLTLATATAFVWAAGRIFRVGLLMQGKAPNLPELFRWIWQ